MLVNLHGCSPTMHLISLLMRQDGQPTAVAHVLLKGAHSVVAAPGGSTYQLISGHPRTARTGLGDVLAGFVAGWGAEVMAAQALLEERADSECLGTAFSAAALLHAEAARTCRQGSIARDVVRRLAELVLEVRYKTKG